MVQTGNVEIEGSEGKNRKMTMPSLWRSREWVTCTNEVCGNKK